MGRARMAVVFSNIVLAVIVGWVAGDAWTRALNNCFYQSGGWNKDSTCQTLIIAVVITVVAFLLYWSFVELFAREVHEKKEE